MTLKYPITITLKQTQEMFNVKVGTLRQWIREGKIKATKPGKEVLVYTDSLVKYLKVSEVA